MQTKVTLMQNESSKQYDIRNPNKPIFVTYNNAAKLRKYDCSIQKNLIPFFLTFSFSYLDTLRYLIVGTYLTKKSYLDTLFCQAKQNNVWLPLLYSGHCESSSGAIVSYCEPM